MCLQLIKILNNCVLQLTGILGDTEGKETTEEKANKRNGGRKRNNKSEGSILQRERRKQVERGEGGRLAHSRVSTNIC